MQNVSDCSSLVEFELPPPPQRFVISDVEPPQSVYGLRNTFSLYSSEGNGTVVIRIRKHLLVRDRRHSQVVLAEIQNSSIGSCHIGQQVVAKVFDPLFVSVDELPSDDAPAKFRQMVASRFCEREVAAYSTLSSLQGTAVPIFYGKFNSHFPSRPTKSDQTVNVILMEHIDGWPLSWYSPEDITQSQGQWILRQTEAIVHQIHSHGVIHHDIAMRNFLLTKLGRMVLVDFEESEILHEKNRYSPEIMKKGDFALLRREFENFGLLPRSYSRGPPASLYFGPAASSIIAGTYRGPACPNDLDDA